MEAPDSSSALRWYETNARSAAERYESNDPEIVHRWWRDQLPVTPAAILDIGAGTGRDAAWLAELGHDVIAVEPVQAMMQEGLRRRPNPRFAIDTLHLIIIHKMVDNRPLNGRLYGAHPSQYH